MAQHHVTEYFKNVKALLECEHLRDGQAYVNALPDSLLWHDLLAEYDPFHTDVNIPQFVARALPLLYSLDESE